ncbi:MAG TPA: IS200/IS605 family transposase [Candidatus Diapherotrites archaeon]|uniref:IS200/IS605 family transposase n=1 Tax=Candidatus Iainarchaeum sp. TaxID=3101447 RepID=A0A7J4IZN6_9ARCH|nr:IS200/IS605 family transposase [Candidatus Diapherotrites archaeon]
MHVDSELYSHNYHKGYWEYHLEWIPEYRYKALSKESTRKECEQILLEIARRLDVNVPELAVLPDHVHMIVVSKRACNPSDLLHAFKGASSHELFKRHPNYRKLYKVGHFWTPGKFSRTVSIASDKAREYVRKQRDAYQQTIADYLH